MTDLDSLFLQPESDWLDWKRNYPGPLLGNSSSPSWDAGRGELLKDLVAIANGEGPEIGYLVYGVADLSTHREVVGLQRHFDDADFQTWASGVFDPMPKFASYEESVNGATVGLVEISRIAGYPHVVTRAVGGIFFEGQVWFRQNSRNVIAKRKDLARMIAGEKPFLFSRIGDPILKNVIDKIQSETGKEAFMPSFDDLDSNSQAGHELVYFPGTRRPIHIGMTDGRPNLVLMLRAGVSSKQRTT